MSTTQRDHSMNDENSSQYGAEAVARATCGTCCKLDVVCAIFPCGVHLRSNCLVDLANVVAFAPVTE